MKKFIVQNTLKVIDIHHSQFASLTENYLMNFFVTYEDKVLKEHIVNIQDAFEDCFTPLEHREQVMAPEKWYTDALKAEISELKTLADKNDAGYIRIIY